MVTNSYLWKVCFVQLFYEYKNTVYIKLSHFQLNTCIFKYLYEGIVEYKVPSIIIKLSHFRVNTLVCTISWFFNLSKYCVCVHNFNFQFFILYLVLVRLRRDNINTINCSLDRCLSIKEVNFFNNIDNSSFKSNAFDAKF